MHVQPYQQKYLYCRSWVAEQRKFLGQMPVIKCPLEVNGLIISNHSILGFKLSNKVLHVIIRLQNPEETRTMSYLAISTELSNGWPIEVTPSASFEDLEAPEMEGPNPLRAQPICTPHLMLQSHVSTNTGVLINTLRTANKSGYLEGGVIIISNPCRPKIATYTTWISLQRENFASADMRNSRWKEAGWKIVVVIVPGYTQSICSIEIKFQYIAHRDHLFWGEATYCQSRLRERCPTLEKKKITWKQQHY